MNWLICAPRQAPIADDVGCFPMGPELDSHDFPVQLSEAGGVHPATVVRVQDIRNALLTTERDHSCIGYLPPTRRDFPQWPGVSAWSFLMPSWSTSTILAGTYRAAARLAASGWHGVAQDRLSLSHHRFLLVRTRLETAVGRQPYLLNREPHATHLRLLEKCGFVVRAELKTRWPGNSKLCRKTTLPPAGCI